MNFAQDILLFLEIMNQKRRRSSEGSIDTAWRKRSKFLKTIGRAGWMWP